MKKQELIHSHILVAIFCGWEACRPNKDFPNGYLKLEDDDDETYKVSNDSILEEIPYQTDREYLTTAVKRFKEEITNEEISNEQPLPELQKISVEINAALGAGDYDRAFHELVKGVEKYNQFKLQEV